MNQSNVLILTSGGLDSTACIHYYFLQKFPIQCVFIDYGQQSAKKEYEAALAVSEFYKLPLHSLSITPSPTLTSDGEIFGRNAFLIFCSLVAIQDHKGIITLGIHSGVPYYDCSPLFVKRMNMILEEYSGGQIQLDVPFLKWDKKMIVLYCKENDVPIYLTYSCERGSDLPCGECMSCKDRVALNVD